MYKPDRKSRNRFRRFSPQFIKRLSSWLVLSTTLVVGLSQATTYYWDPDTNAYNDSVAFGGSGTGGAGTWNTTIPQWWVGSGFSEQTWSNAGNDTAVFSGTAGTVTLGEPITVGGLQFNTTGYAVVASTANPLSFGAVNSALTLNNVFAATITGQVGGSGGVTLGGGVFGALTPRAL
jgi:hypothetical protein